MPAYTDSNYHPGFPDPQDNTAGGDSPDPKTNTSEPVIGSANPTTSPPNTGQNISSDSISPQTYDDISIVEPSITPENTDSTPPSQDNQNQSPVSGNVISTPNSDSGSNNVNKKFMLPMLGVLLLVLSVGTGVILVRQNQNIQEQAAGNCQPPTAGSREWWSIQIGNGDNLPRVDTGQITGLEPGSTDVVVEAWSDSAFGCGKNQQDETAAVELNDQVVNITDTDVPGSTTVKVKIGQDGILHIAAKAMGNPGSMFVLVRVHGPKATTTPRPSATPSNAPTATPTLTPTPPPTTAPARAYCGAVTAYSTDWEELSSTELTQLRSGTVIYFAAEGRATNGNIDKTRFKINNGEWIETTNTSPDNNNLYYIEYTIPGTGEYKVSAQVHLAQDNSWY